MTTTQYEQAKLDTAHALYHAGKTLDAYVGDLAGRNDIVRLIARLTELYHEQGGDAASFASYCSLRDAQAEPERAAGMSDWYHEKTGLCG